MFDVRERVLTRCPLDPELYVVTEGWCRQRPSEIRGGAQECWAPAIGLISSHGGGGWSRSAHLRVGASEGPYTR